MVRNRQTETVRNRQAAENTCTEKGEKEEENREKHQRVMKTRMEGVKLMEERENERKSGNRWRRKK